MKIVTEAIYPSIPTNAFDFCTYIDGEEDSICEFGITEKEAIENLKELMETLNEY